MPLNASKVKSTARKDRPAPLDAGTYPVRVVQVLDVGLQKQRPYKGEDKEPAYEIWVTYEFLDEFLLDEEGNEDTTKPRWLSENFVVYSLDSDLAKSTKRYFALDPDKEHGGDWASLIGAPGMLTIVQNPDKKDPSIVYNNITGLSSMRKKEADKAPELVNTGKVFDMDNPDMDVFWSLPKFMQAKMTEENLDFPASALESAIQAHPEPSKGEGTKEEPKASQESSQEVEDKPEEEEDW